MAGDWLKLHRKIIRSAVASDPWLLQLWIFCLAKANWQRGFFLGHEIPPGAFAFAGENFAAELGVSRMSLLRGLKRLQSLGQITQKANNRFTIVTICNWQTYQDFDAPERTTSEQPANNQRTTSEQPANTIEEGKEREEGKKGRKNTRARTPIGEMVIPDSLQSASFAALWREWQDHRKEIRKPLTFTAAKQQLVSLAAMGPERAAAALRHSIANGWQGIFEPAPAGAINGSRKYSADNLFAGETQ